jgi:hypothetical protein
LNYIIRQVSGKHLIHGPTILLTACRVGG